MSRFLSAVSAVALMAGFATAAQAQSYPPPSGESYSTTTTTTNSTVAQAPVRQQGFNTDVSALRSGPYVRLDTGYSWATNSRIDDSAIVGGGIGWRFTPNLRSDLTFHYRPDYNQQTTLGVGPGARTGLDNWTLMANGYYDFNLEAVRPLVPYVGAGFGIAHNSVNGVSVAVPGTGVANFTGRDTTQFAWQLSAGAAYYFTPNTALDVGYRYVHAGETGFNGRLKANELTASVRFGF